MASKDDADIDALLSRGGLYLANGKYKKAQVQYRRVLDREPDNARALASQVSIDAALGRISNEEALSNVREMIDANPDNDRLPITLINLLVRMKRMDEYALERTRYFENYPDSPIALQIQANGLQVDPGTKDSPDTPGIAWGYYQRALQSGPLMSPCFREVALRAARRADPEHAETALAGASLIERLTIRTRVWGPQPMALLYSVGICLGALLWGPNLVAGIAVQAGTLTWGLWVIYCNSQLCCKRCRNAWAVMVVFFTLIDVAIDHSSTWFIPAGVDALFFLWLLATGKLKPTSGAPSQSRKASSLSVRSTLVLTLVMLCIVDSFVVERVTNHQISNSATTWWELILYNVFFVVGVTWRFRSKSRFQKR